MVFLEQLVMRLLVVGLLRIQIIVHSDVVPGRHNDCRLTSIFEVRAHIESRSLLDRLLSMMADYLTRFFEPLMRAHLQFFVRKRRPCIRKCDTATFSSILLVLVALALVRSQVLKTIEACGFILVFSAYVSEHVLLLLMSDSALHLCENLQLLVGAKLLVDEMIRLHHRQALVHPVGSHCVHRLSLGKVHSDLLIAGHRRCKHTVRLHDGVDSVLNLTWLGLLQGCRIVDR